MVDLEEMIHHANDEAWLGVCTALCVSECVNVIVRHIHVLVAEVTNIVSRLWLSGISIYDKGLYTFDALRLLYVGLNRRIWGMKC